MENVIKSGNAGTVGNWPRRLVIMTALIAIGVSFDGLDSLILPPSLPLIGGAWHVNPSSFAPVFALSTIGYVIGSIIAGITCDRRGRRPTVIASVVIIGIGSFITAISGGLPVLSVARVITGIGIGGALATVFTAVPEFTPPRWRSIAVSSATLGEPVGGFLASAACAVFLQNNGWRTLFVAGGIIPLVYAVILAVGFVETPAFLSAKPERKADLQKVLAKLQLAPNHVLAQPVQRRATSGVSSLLSNQYRHDTLLLWCAGFLWLLFLFTILDWLPSLVSAGGGSIRLSATVLAVFSLGAAIGNVLSVMLVQPLGTRRSLSLFGVMMVATSGVLAWRFGDAALSPQFMLWLVGASGFACAAGQSCLIVLMPHVYAAEHRGTGVGFSLGAGRLGTIAAAFVGSAVMAHGGRAYFLTELVIALGAFVCAINVRAQVPPFWKGVPEDPEYLELPLATALIPPHGTSRP